MNKDIRAAMLGDHEAAKRLTENKEKYLQCSVCNKHNMR